MATNITMPSLSADMEEATISKWLVAAGDSVSKGQVLAEIETDKATMELEAEDSGTIGKLLAKDGESVKIGVAIAIILAEGETLSDAPAVAPTATSPEKTAPAIESEPVAAIASHELGVAPGAPGRVKASPLATRIAAAAGVSLSNIKGSGPAGRIVRLDVEREINAGVIPQAIKAPATVPQEIPQSGEMPVGIGEHEVLPLSGMRRTIARRLTESKQHVPHFYLESDVIIDDLLELRARLNESLGGQGRISVNDLVIKACARALRECPEARVVWAGDSLLRPYDVDISVAVATEGGLFTPILRSADRMSLGTLSSEMKTLAERARSGGLKPQDYQGGSFSISNLGMYGVDRFTAIINPPQSGILAVGAAGRRPLEHEGGVRFVTSLTLTLSVDHRAVDGAVAAQLLAQIKIGLENPLSLLI